MAYISPAVKSVKNKKASGYKMQGPLALLRVDYSALD